MYYSLLQIRKESIQGKKWLEKLKSSRESLVIDSFMIWDKDVFLILLIPSLILSKTIIVSFNEYPRSVRIAAKYQIKSMLKSAIAPIAYFTIRGIKCLFTEGNRGILPLQRGTGTFFRNFLKIWAKSVGCNSPLFFKFIPNF